MVGCVSLGAAVAMGTNTWAQAGQAHEAVRWAVGPLESRWVKPVNQVVNQDVVVEEVMPGFLGYAEPLAMTEALFLGVSCEPVGGALAAQLPVPQGVGLVVTHVAPDSPAQRAGVKTHDVLVKLNDQWLINPGQLAVLVRMQDDGLIELHVRRAGEDLALTPQLELREVPELSRSVQTPILPQMVLPSRVNQKRLAELQRMIPRVEFDGGRNLMLKFKDQEHGFRLQMPEEGDGRVSVYGPNEELLQEFNLSELEEHIEEVLHTKLSALHEHLEEMDLDDHMSRRLEALEEALVRANEKRLQAEASFRAEERQLEQALKEQQAEEAAPATEPSEE